MLKCRRKYRVLCLDLSVFSIHTDEDIQNIDYVEVIRNFRAIDAQLSTVIEVSFANQKINFGDNDMMRWYTNNVLRHLKKDGNVEYIKKEDVRRRT